MIDIDVDTTGFQTFQGTLSDLQAEAFISPELETFGKAVVEVAEVYPPKGLVFKSGQRVKKERAIARAQGGGGKAGSLLAKMVGLIDISRSASDYQRTGSYGANWHTSTQGLEERITNEAEYAGYVGGLDASPDGRSGARGNQPWTWRYGWPRLVKVAQEVMDNWITFMEAKAQELWER